MTDQMHQGFGGSVWSWIFFKKWNLFDSVKSIAICYLISALILGFLAVLTSIIYFPLQDHKIPYADITGCLDNFQTKKHSSNNHSCQISFTISKQMKPPVNFLYYIENAYINHRHYLDSYSKTQLQGNVIDLKTAKEKCYPFMYNKDMGKNVSWSGKKLDPDAIASPCGFKAFLFFNDTFKLKKVGQKQSQNIKIDESKINEVQGLGIDYKSRNPDQQWIDPSDQHFVMWMQTQSLMTKQKLWGKIKQPLKPGNYSLIVENNYKINNMRITKGVRILEGSSLGGKTYFIPALFAVGSIGCLLFAIIFYKKFSSLDHRKKDD